MFLSSSILSRFIQFLILSSTFNLLFLFKPPMKSISLILSCHTFFLREQFSPFVLHSLSFLPFNLCLTIYRLISIFFMDLYTLISIYPLFFISFLCLCHYCPLSLPLSVSVSLPLSLYPSPSLSLSLCPPLSLYIYISPSLSLSLSPSLSLSISLSLSLILSRQSLHSLLILVTLISHASQVLFQVDER